MVIEELAKHPCMYDENHEKFHSRKLRTSTWEIIAESLSNRTNNKVTSSQAKRVYNGTVEKCRKLRTKAGASIGSHELIELENALALVKNVELKS